jgi:hypothetical protein
VFSQGLPDSRPLLEGWWTPLIVTFTVFTGIGLVARVISPSPSAAFLQGQRVSNSEQAHRLPAFNRQ